MHHAVLAFLIHEVLDLRAQLRIGDVIAIITHAGDEELLALREQQRHRIEETGLERIVVEPPTRRSEKHTAELQSLMRNTYHVVCVQKNRKQCRIYTAHDRTPGTNT